MTSHPVRVLVRALEREGFADVWAGCGMLWRLGVRLPQTRMEREGIVAIMRACTSLSDGDRLSLGRALEVDAAFHDLAAGWMNVLVEFEDREMTRLSSSLSYRKRFAGKAHARTIASLEH